MDETDVLSALESLSCQRRAEGETSFPDWPTVLEEVRIFGMRRRIAERRAEEEAEKAKYEARVRENPEEFVSVHEMWKEVSERIAKKESAA
jgi:hypothetical protein